MAKKTRETAMQALDKLENFPAKTTEILRLKFWEIAVVYIILLFYGAE